MFPPGPRMGIAAGNAAEALEVLREVAVDYYCTAEQVDLLAELFDDIPHKVRPAPGHLSPVQQPTVQQPTVQQPSAWWSTRTRHTALYTYASIQPRWALLVLLVQEVNIYAHCKHHLRANQRRWLPLHSPQPLARGDVAVSAAVRPPHGAAGRGPCLGRSHG